MKKQTAVEWLYSKTLTSYDGPETGHEELLQVAKEIEREQLFEAFDAGANLTPSRRVRIVGHKELFKEYIANDYGDKA